MKKLGILGGMGPMATADFYQKVVSMTQSNDESEHIYTFIESNPLIPDRSAFIAKKGPSPLKELTASMRRLQKAGAEVIVMPCNTAHHFYKSLNKKSTATFINMIDETVRYTMETLKSEEEGLYVGLLATKGTYASKLYQKAAEEYGFKLYIPDDPTKQLLMDAIYALKSSNYDALPELQAQIFKYLETCNFTGWILGCTELPIILKDGIDRFSLIDSSMVLAKAAIEAVGGTVVTGK